MMRRRAILQIPLLPLGATATTSTAPAPQLDKHKGPPLSPPAAKVYVETIKKVHADGPDDQSATEMLKQALAHRGLRVLSLPSASASGVQQGLDPSAYRLTKVLRVKAKLLPPSLGLRNASSEMDIQAVLVAPDGTETTISPIESRTEFTSSEWTGRDVEKAAADRALASLVGRLADAVLKLAAPPRNN